MAQHDYLLDDGPGIDFRADLNGALAAVKTRNSHASTPPANPAQGQQWCKTVSSTVQESYEFDGVNWVHLYTINPTTHDFRSVDGVRRQWGGVAGGTANALTITTSPAISGYENGQRFALLTAGAANTGAMTLAVDGQSAIPIKMQGQDPAAGDVPANTPLEVIIVSNVAHVIGGPVKQPAAPASVRTVTGTTDSITTADKGRTIVYTNAAGCTVTLPTLATAGSGFECEIVNRGSADVTLNRAGSNTFDGGGTAVKVQKDSGRNKLRLYSIDQSAWYTSERRFRSAGQSISAGAQRQVAHGLGAVPRKWRHKLRCTSAEFGYSVGDELIWGSLELFDQVLAHNKGATIRADATNVTLRYGSGAAPHFCAPRADTGAETNLTDANWESILEADF